MANQTLGLLGRKIGMTQLFAEDGAVIPVTVIQAGPCTVMQVKTAGSRDGYDAVQLGFGTKKTHRANKPELGRLESARMEEPPTHVREFRLDAETVGTMEPGRVLTVADVFAEGEKVDVCGTSKGRGFAGVMKRYNMKGFIRTHGVHEFFRHGGSIGTRLTPGMVLKGKKMPGHLGSERVTVQNLHVARVDTERNLIFIRGGVPGPNGAVVSVRKAVKAGS
ncbi:MAG TPA: 50S ribosomal protein L3 [Deltaproteobacteria bacterium]|nr:50S ribosomal protein L3 [Deltaproteobacteria bacterium]